MVKIGVTHRLSRRFVANITFVVDDLASNAIGRAAPLANAVQSLGHSVRVAGFLLSGDSVYEPYMESFDYRCVNARSGMRRKIHSLTREINGDLIYCCKPLLSTLVPSLLAARFGFGRPLILDVEDNELWTGKVCREDSFYQLRRIWHLRYNYAIHPFFRCARAVTVVSTRLQSRYGGQILLHGPDETLFDPERPELEPRKCREMFGLPHGGSILLFVGTPHPHKGVDMFAAALRDPRLREVALVLVGPNGHPTFTRLERELPGRVTVLGMMPNRLMPALLAAADIVATPQLSTEFSEYQVPAKLLEAMAMEKIIVASSVSDLPSILGVGELKPRGWLHSAGDSNALADAIFAAKANPAEAQRRARAARAWYLKNASRSAIARRLGPLIESVIRR